MEISRHFKPVSAIPGDTVAPRQDLPRPTPQAAAQVTSLPLEQMQEALRAMPEVDLDRVEAIRQALQQGDISSDPAELASSMLAYHRGTDA